MTRRLAALALAWLGLCALANGFDLNEPPPESADWEPAGPGPEQRPGAPQPPPLPPPPPHGLARRLLNRARQAVPSYFSFEGFVERFGRHYERSEAFLRRSIFTAKLAEIFRTRVQFRMGRLGYRTEVNKFADRSAAEFGLMFQPAPAPDPATADPAQLAAYRARLAEHQRRLKTADRAHLADLVETESSLAELGRTDEERARRQLAEHVGRLRAELARELDARELEALMEEAVREELADMGFETFTQAALSGAPETDAPPELPWPGQLSSAGRPAGPPPGEPYRPPALAAHQALDWSRHACFHEVYDQGEACGRCYVYAATALAEFYACTELGPGRPVKRRKFSKDFVTDCAQKFSPNVLGCAGGSLYDTLRFIALAGANKIRSWRETRQTSVQALFAELAGGQPEPLDMRCPLDPHRLPVARWGEVRLTLNPKPAHPNEWLEALQDGPLAVSVQMPPAGVDSYAGGVHDGRGCESSGLWHAMLLVGYGQDERGQPFWRFRNSFGPDWGDAGHFNLAMGVPGGCLREGQRVFREPCESCGA